MTDLVVVGPPSPSEWTAIKAQSEAICRTEFVPKGLRGRPEAVLAAVLTGRELGIGPMQALQQVSVIDGKPSLSSELQRALVFKAGHSITIEHSDETRAVVLGTRSSGQTDRVEWTLEDAKRAGLAGKHNWKTYPRQMLVARATSELVRRLFPDVLAGVSYTPEELTDGEVIEVDEIGPGRGEAEEQGTVREAASPASSADEAGELRKVWWKLAQDLGADADTFKDYFATRYPMYESTHDLSVDELEAEIAFLSAVNDPWAKFIETIKPEVFTQEGSPEGSGASTGDLSDTDKGRYRRKLYAIGRKLGHDSDGVKELLKASKLIESSTDELDEAGWKAAIAAFETKAKEAESA